MKSTASVLLRYLVGNPACNMIVGCNLDVPGIADTPQGSVVVMTGAVWAGDVIDRRSNSGIEVWVKSSYENTWYPVYASSKKENMVCLSSGESELMALVGGACEGVETRDQRSKMCNCSLGTIVPCTDSSAALGFVKRKGASRRTRHVYTKVYFMQAWAMEPGQRILKLHGDSQQVADCLHDSSSGSSQSLGTVTDAAICRTSMSGDLDSFRTIGQTSADFSNHRVLTVFGKCISMSHSPSHGKRSVYVPPIKVAVTKHGFIRTSWIGTTGGPSMKFMSSTFTF